MAARNAKFNVGRNLASTSRGEGTFGLTNKDKLKAARAAAQNLIEGTIESNRAPPAKPSRGFNPAPGEIQIGNTDETAGGFPGFVGDLNRHSQGVADLGAGMLVDIVNSSIRGVTMIQDTTGLSKLADVRAPVLDPARDDVVAAADRVMQIPNPFPASEAGQTAAEGLMGLVNSAIESDVVQKGLEIEDAAERGLNEALGTPVPGALLYAAVNTAIEVGGPTKGKGSLARAATKAPKPKSTTIKVKPLNEAHAEQLNYRARGDKVRLMINPDEAALARLSDPDSFSDKVRFMVDKSNGDIYVWPANEAIHNQVIDSLGAKKEDFDVWSDYTVPADELYDEFRAFDEFFPETYTGEFAATRPAIMGGAVENVPAIADAPKFLPDRKLTKADRQRLAKLDEKYPGVKPLLKYLTPDEARALNGRNVQGFLDTFGELDPSEMASVALAGQAKRGWYEQSSQALVNLFGDEDSMRFAGLLAAMSPQTSVESNLRNALTTWLNWDKAGRPNDPESILRIMGESVEGDKGIESVLGAWRQNSIDALSAPDVTSMQLSGAKVDSFMQNIWGNFAEVTNDAWIAKYTGLDQNRFSGSRSTNVAGESVPGRKTGVYTGINAATRKAAELLTRRTGEVWTPAEVQETIWSWSKSISEKANTSNTPITDLIADLTHSEVSDVPDFGTLLSQQGEFRTILEGGGFDARQLDALATGNRAAPIDPAGQAAAGTGIQPRHLDAAAQRLEAARRTGQKPKAVDDLRASVDRSVSGDAAPAFERRARGNRERNVEATYSLPAARVQRLNSLGISTPAVQELRANGPQRFLNSIEAAKASTPYGSQVTAKTLKEYENMRLFMTEDGKAGFALDGEDIVSLFNHGKSPHTNISTELVMLAIEQGGRTLDNYDTFLTHIYEKLGFQEVQRFPWDDAQKPADWNFETYQKFNNGRPDYVFMEYRPTESVLEEMAKKSGNLNLGQPGGQQPVPIGQNIDLSRFDGPLRQSLG